MRYKGGFYETLMYTFHGEEIHEHTKYLQMLRSLDDELLLNIHFFSFLHTFIICYVFLVFFKLLAICLSF